MKKRRTQTSGSSATPKAATSSNGNNNSTSTSVASGLSTLSTSSSNSSSSTVVPKKDSFKGIKTTPTTSASSSSSSSKPPAYSQVMLLELLLTVTRGSLLIVTPLVASMTLQVAPRMLEPIYGSIFIEDQFLEYCFGSILFGIVMGLIYDQVVSLKKTTTTTTTTTTKTTTNNNTTTRSSLKDARIRHGIMVSLDLMALILVSTPYTVRYLFKFSPGFGPWKGPHLTQLVFAYPILALLAFTNTLALVLNTSERTKTHIRTWLSFVVIQVGTIVSLTVVLYQMTTFGFGGNGSTGNASLLPSSSSSSSSSVSCSRIYTAAILTAVASGLCKILNYLYGEVALPEERLQEKRIDSGASLALSYVPLVMIVALAAQVAYRHPQCQAGLTKSHNIAGGNYTMLARNESITGWISVVDELVPRNNLHIRVMRAGHSLIGGMYAETQDSIFGTFYIPEAVRMIKGRNNDVYNHKNKDDSDQQQQQSQHTKEMALQIGLGVGIASGTLMQQGVLVDVVEIDPVVVDYARDYFDWPKPHQLFIQDGRQFIKNAPTAKYDYVIHDVFTGGGVPPSLFSIEALLDIKRIMKPDGVLALNFVGTEDPAKGLAFYNVRHTLHGVFRNVEGYMEDVDHPETYQNIVFFATNLEEPIGFKDFKAPDPKEYKRTQKGPKPSVMREWILSSFQDWKLKTIYDPETLSSTSKDGVYQKAEWIFDRNNTLNGMQRAGAEDHWHAMRSLFSADFWMNY